VNETHITVVGNVVDTPRRNRLTNGSVTNFRLASTARRFDGDAKDFVDSTTLWIDVACWGELGGNVAHSVSKGDPVIVQGTIATDSWETEAGRRSAAKIRATSVGLNLARGWAEFHKPVRQNAAAETAAAVAEAAAGERRDPADELADDRPFDDLAGRSTDYTDTSATLHPMNTADLTDERAPEPTLT
jgi:single-strand DNA-binding protein